MEVFWTNDPPVMTAREVIRKVQDRSDMSPRMVRVLLCRLWQKGVLSYTIDEHDSRVYHYSVQKSKEECQREKAGNWKKSWSNVRKRMMMGNDSAGPL